MDGLENQRPLCTPVRNFQNIIKRHKDRLLHYMKQYWKERCTIRWVNFGDENSKFFHAMAAQQYRRNTITQLQTNDGRVVTSHHDKVAILWNAYKDRMGVSMSPIMHFDLVALVPQIDGLYFL